MSAITVTLEGEDARTVTAAMRFLDRDLELVVEPETLARAAIVGVCSGIIRGGCFPFPLTAEVRAEDGADRDQIQRLIKEDGLDDPGAASPNLWHWEDAK